MTAEHVKGLMRSLQQNRTGANAHTASKAHTYMRQVLYFIENGQTELRPRSKAFVTQVQKTLLDGNWKKLSDLMRGWF